jgi:hypothetical protein
MTPAAAVRSAMAVAGSSTTIPSWSARTMSPASTRTPPQLTGSFTAAGRVTVPAIGVTCRA